MTKLRQFLGGLICALCGWMLTACSSEEDSLQIPEGKGYVKLNLTADAGFQTKAVDEETYKNLDNYTVQILKDGEVLKEHEWKYSEMPEFIQLETNSYSMRVFNGDSTKAVYTDDLCFLGSEGFTVKNDTVSVQVACKPNSARIKIEFDSKMATYFSSYYAEIKTAALNSPYKWENTMQGPVYFKVNNNETVTVTIHMADESGTKTEKSVTYTLSPADATKITVSPSVNAGNLSIKIEIDETVIEHPVDIEIPSDWV